MSNNDAIARRYMDRAPLLYQVSLLRSCYDKYGNEWPLTDLEIFPGERGTIFKYFTNDAENKIKWSLKNNGQNLIKCEVKVLKLQKGAKIA